MLRITLATLHLLALGFGLGAVIDRAAALRDPVSLSSLRRVFRADSIWGISALIWITTGLWRLFGAMEKSASYYLGNHVFYAKMGLLAVILVLEIWPAMTLVRWRIVARRGAGFEQLATPERARRIAVISIIEAVLVVGMVVAAVAMARGAGARD